MCKTTQHHITKKTKTQTQPDFDAAVMLLTGTAAFVPLSRGTDGLRHPHDWRRCKISPPIRFALRWTRMLCLPVHASKQGTAAEHTRTNTHGLTYQKRRLRPWCTTTRRPLPQLIRYSPLAVSEGDPASCARLCIHSVTMRAARGSSTAQARVRGDGPTACF